MEIAGLLQALQIAQQQQQQHEQEYLRRLAEEQELKARLEGLTQGRMVAAGKLAASDAIVQQLQQRLQQAQQQQATPAE